MRRADRWLALGILVLALRLVCDVATPFSPGAFVLTSAGIQGGDAWTVRVLAPATPEPADRAASPAPAGRAPVVSAARFRLTAPPRRVEHPLRIPGHAAPACSSPDASSDH
jgi:hypothetical protein